MFKKEVIKNYLSFLRDRYLQEIFVIPSTILVIIIDAVNRNSFGWLDGLAISLLILYLFYLFNDVKASVVAITINLESGYSLCLGKSEIQYADSIRKQKDTLNKKKIDLAKIFSHYRVIDFDWQYHDNTLTPPTEWCEKITHINEHFLRYALRIPTDTKLHMFLIAPCPIAIGLGYSIGKERPWTIYHYDTLRYVYIPIELTNPNSVSKGRYRHININSSDSKNQSTNIVVNISIIPKPSIPLPQISDQVIEITAKEPPDQVSYFAPLALEILDYLNEILRQGKTVHLFPGLPISLGFMLGKGLVEPANLHVYNLNRDTDQWECVLKLQKLAAE